MYIVNTARAGGSVAVPVTWDELGGVDRANGFDIFAAAACTQGPDDWARFLKADKGLTAKMLQVIKGTYISVSVWQ